MTLRTTLVLALVALGQDASAGGDLRKSKKGKAPPVAGPTATAESSGGSRTVSGPYVHDNLAVFLIHGDEALPGEVFATLEEGLESKKVVVHETGSVAQLAIENLGKVPVFIQAGEIVKGGRQDRTLKHDLVLAPKSGKVPIASFCVESGRWAPRGNESDQQFSSSKQMLVTKGQRLAAKSAGSQGEVWKKVSEAQDALTANTGASVRSKKSSTSLQLSLENKKVTRAATAYTRALAPIVGGKTDVIGYAFAINGEINSVDIYGSRVLFQKLWPKLIRASAVEALAGRTAKKISAPAKAVVDRLLADAAAAEAKQEDLSPRTRLITRETDRAVSFSTRDRDHRGAEVHKNVISK